MTAETDVSSTAVQTSRPGGNAVQEVAMQREIAEVQGAILMARKFPRDVVKALDRITIACQRPGLAEAALYTYARGGTDVTGPSIRLAEAIAQQWGNIQFGIRELDQRNGESTVEAFAWDIETNTRQIKTFQVPHVRYTKAKGNTKLTDPRDVYEMVANQGARRLRACILGIIPGDIIETAVEQCESTMKAKADTSPEAIKKLVEAFSNLGVTKEQLEKKLQRRVDAIMPAQVVGLRKIYNSLKDGMSSPADWFEGRDAGAELEKRIKTPAPDAQEAPGESPQENTIAGPPVGTATAEGLSGARLRLYDKIADMAASDVFEINKILSNLSGGKVKGKEDLIKADDALIQELFSKTVGGKK